MLLLLLLACTPASKDPGDTASDTAETGAVPACEAGSRPGAAGSTDGLETVDGILFNVRTPEGYDPTVAWPLMVLYAGAGGDPQRMEEATRMTPDATGAGFVITYPDHLSPSSTEALEQLARVPEAVEETWCIDPARVYLTGHSDGGSTSSVIPIWGLLDPPPAAIAPSAAGVDRAWVEAEGCPATLPVMVMHSQADTLFPESEGFGAQVAEWWATCNGCDPEPGPALEDGCVPYTGCTGEVLYCEGSGSHPTWPGLNASIVDFFARN